MQETWVPSLGREDPLQKEMATRSSILAWEIPWTEESGRLQSMESQRVGDHLATKQQQGPSGITYMTLFLLPLLPSHFSSPSLPACLFPSGPS